MRRKGSSESISIRPGISILSVLQHLNYRPWFALAEFVDNSLQSYLDYREELEEVEGDDFKLRVSIEHDPTGDGHLIVRDNAAGIHKADYARAFRPAEIPPDQSGLSEFGMGMKSAACWFAPQWEVRTSALGEPLERTVSFDIEVIVRDELEELDVQTRKVPSNAHFTEIVLSSLNRQLQGRTITKIKEHLASIYRMFIREGTLELLFDNEVLSYPEPKVSHAPFYKTPTAEPKQWLKEIDFDFGLGLRAYGFAAIRETASTSRAGFALFRRHRLIQGSADEGYRPEYIFGKPNSYRYQRLFGELQLEGFEVSHTKDGFQWAEHEEVFLDLLKEQLDDKPLPLLEQAEEHRVRPKKADLRKGAEIASGRTAETIKREVPPVLEGQLDAPPESQPPPKALPSATMASTREIIVELHGITWQILLELSNDPGVGEWLTVSDRPSRQGTGANAALRSARQVSVRLALAHPFMDRFSGADPERIEPMLRIAAAIAFAETSARDSGVRMAGTVRRNINDFLRKALSKP